MKPRGAKALSVLSVLSVLLGGATQSAPAAEATVGQGARVFQHWCLDCHGSSPYATGTRELKRKYHGTVPAVLDSRSDLTQSFVIYAVRHGVSFMPYFRKTEISDGDLAALCAYLSADPKLGPRTRRQPGRQGSAGG